MKEKLPPTIKFSAPRHRTIAELANDFLSPKASTQVQKLLKKISQNTTNLKQVSTWADDIKPTMKKRPTDSETVKFLSKFPDTREWHFVDLPLDAKLYDTSMYAPFTRENDVVQMLVECIQILTGHSRKFSKTNALRWLVHLIGDIHQPLHIACSYIDYSKPIPELVFKKDQILQRNLLQKSDKGGNKINLPIGSQGKALHSYWDGDLPNLDDDFAGETYNPLPQIPIEALKNLPADWVSQNIQYTKEAYDGLTVKGKNPSHPTYVDVLWNKSDYNKKCVPLIKDLSIKAANRLAFILNTIYE